MKRVWVKMILIGAAMVMLAGCGEEETVAPNDEVMGGTTTSGAAMTVVSSDNIKSQKLIPAEHRTTDLEYEKMAKDKANTWDNPKVVLDPYGDSPLTAYVLFSTPKSLKVRVTIAGHKKKYDITDSFSSAKEHRVPVVGLYAGKKNKVTLETLDDNGKVTATKKLVIKTKELPNSMKDALRVEKKGTESAYHLTLVSGQTTTYPFAYDEEGEIRWFVKVKTSNYGIFPLSDGHYMLQPNDSYITTEEKPHTTQMHEMDYLGRCHSIYYVKKGYHHEVIEKEAGGNLLVLSSSIDGHVEDVVEEIDRETGKIVKSLDMRDLFDDTYENMIDWVHLNTASYKAEDDSVLLSPRNLHSAIKVNLKTDKLQWILANPEFFKGTKEESKVLKPIGSVKWHYQQHSVYEIPYDLDGNPDTIHIMMYDNHWNTMRKVAFFDGDLSQSYVSIYTINEKKMTVKQEKTFPGVKSKITSNCSYDRKTNHIFSFGGYLDPLVNGRKGMIYEFDYKSGQIVNQYSTKNYFYRGYEMTMAGEALAAPMEQDSSYIKGTLLAPTEITMQEVPDETTEKGTVSFTLKDSILYTKLTDHAILKIRFIGKNKTYVMDYSAAGKGEKKYRNTSYVVAIPMEGMDADTYQIVVNYKNEWQNTEKSVKIEK